jgi:diguanylate cyclase (GGDEF)-like protein
MVQSRRLEILEALREQVRLLPEAANDAGFRSLTGRGPAWIARTSTLINEIDVARGSHFRARGTDLPRVGSGGGNRQEFMSLFAELSVLLETEVAQLAGESPLELEQKFKILLSAGQAERDFIEYRTRFGTETPIAVLFLDVDHFGKLNAQYTEEIVDQDLLPPLMYLLRNACAGRGCAYRQGGDEFIMILPNTDLVEARAFAERLLLSLRQTPFSIAGSVKNMTASIGIACSGQDDTDFPAVRLRANLAKKEAKRTRDCVHP